MVTVVDGQSFLEEYASRDSLAERATGLAEADEVESAYVLHAGTAYNTDREVVASGGRVLSVVGLGADLADAREQAYAAVDRIELAGSHYRSDIALAAELGEVRVP